MKESEWFYLPQAQFWGQEGQTFRQKINITLFKYLPLQSLRSVEVGRERNGQAKKIDTEFTCFFPPPIPIKRRESGKKEISSYLVS